MRLQSVGELLGSSAGLVFDVLAVLATFLAGSGDICSAVTTNRFRLVPGGSQVISVNVAGLSGKDGYSTETSVGATTFLSNTL